MTNLYYVRLENLNGENMDMFATAFDPAGAVKMAMTYYSLPATEFENMAMAYELTSMAVSEPIRSLDWAKIPRTEVMLR